MDNLLLEVEAVLSISSGRWDSLVREIPTDQLERRPVHNEWSASECLEHLLEAEKRVFPIRLQAFLDGDDIRDYDPDIQAREDKPKPDPKLIASEFADLRKKSLQSLRRISKDDLLLTTMHSKLGKVTLQEMLCEWAGHDLMHLVQAERALMQEFIQGSGPWRSYFSDHDASNG
jgi:hypothetical protein